MREKRILHELISSKQHCSLDYLSRCLDVSTRTISSDIRYLIQIGEYNGFRIHLKRRSGYYLEIFDFQKFEMFLEQENNSSALTNKNRVETIVAMLLINMEYLTQEKIAEALQVSKSIIKVDMAKVEKELSNHDIQLVKKAHYGVMIKTNMLKRKLYVMELLKRNNLFLEKLINKNLSLHDVQNLEKELISLLKQYNLDTNYIELKEIDLFLKITILFSQDNKEIEKFCFSSHDLYEKLAFDLGNVIHDICRISLKENDIQEIREYLIQKTKPTTVFVDNDGLKEDIEVFLEKTDIEYQTHFNDDNEFKKGLLSHVTLLLDRLYQSISFSNPLVHEISVKYPMIFNIGIRFGGMLEEKYHVKMSQDEIGFIATHFAVHMEKELHNRLNQFHRIAIICSSGGGSAFLIKLKLETIFSASEIRTFSLLEMEEVKVFEPDIIFTIKELKEKFNVPTVLIRELLDDSDIQKIKNLLEADVSKIMQNQTFTSLFRKNAFHIFEDGTYGEMLDIMSEQLVENQYCDALFPTYVKQREDVLSCVYQNGIALPHPVEMCGTVNVLSVGIVKHTVEEKGKTVHIIFLVNLEKGDLNFHKNITKVLFKIMSDVTLISEIRRSNCYEDFIKCIAHLNF